MNAILGSRTNRREFICSAMAAAVAQGLPDVIRAEEVPNALQQRLATDPQRPQIHLLPAANWMNDPNGPIYWKGRYHLFYQYDPQGAYWGDMHWGHAISTDMLHWQHMPIALAPTPGGPDAAGCFTGSAIVDGDRVVVLYTGVVNDGSGKPNSFRESQCLAYSVDPRLIQWTKLDKPVIASPPPELNTTGFRDPSAWEQGDWYYMTVGSGIPKVGGAVLLYRSKDLEHWTYMHVLAQGPWPQIAPGFAESGDMWECPEFFALGDKHVLIYSAEAKVFWHCGKLDPETMRFHAEKHGVMDLGDYYAAKTQLDAQARRVVWGWILEQRPEEQFRAAGWAGVMSLPRVLTLGPESELRMTFAPELKGLRQGARHLLVTADEQVLRKQLAGMSLDQGCGEILGSLRADESFDLSLVSDEPQMQGWLTFRYDAANRSVHLDQKTFTLDQALETFEFHVYVDGSVLELLIDQKIAYTKRFYYAGSRAPRMFVRLNGSPSSLLALTIWTLSSISPNRLTA